MAERARPRQRMVHRMLRGLLVGLLGLAIGQTAGLAQQRGGRAPFIVQGADATATSGDAIIVDNTPVRLIGIAAPLPGQTCRNRYGRLYDCFAVARAVLSNLMDGREVVCRVVYVTSAGENLGHCSVGIDLSQGMVVRGWAFARSGLTHDYARMESYAQARRRGMWSGHVEKPWQWEARQQRDRAP